MVTKREKKLCNKYAFVDETNFKCRQKNVCLIRSTSGERKPEMKIRKECRQTQIKSNPRNEFGEHCSSKGNTKR